MLPDAFPDKVRKAWEADLKSNNRLVHSQVDGVSDLIWSMGMDTFRNEDYLKRWLKTPDKLLDDLSPLQVLKKYRIRGTSIICGCLDRILHGIPW